jgi:hypothetical protein
MIKLEVHILSDRREGLLIELGRLVIANGFTLLRRRLFQDSQGIWLMMLISGQAEKQFVLEEILASHPRVLSFEAALIDDTAGATLAGAASAPASQAFSPPAEAVLIPPAAVMPEAGPNVAQVENVLPHLASVYPKIIPVLQNLVQAVVPASREASLRVAGRRTGAWLYKRDYALGAKLDLADAIKRIATPALRDLTVAEWSDRELHIKNCPLCSPGTHMMGCSFFGGFLEGLLGAALSPTSITARNLLCRSKGAQNCIIGVM